MKQLLLIGLVTLLLVTIIGAGIFLVRASSDYATETLEVPRGCGSCDGTCSSSSACGQAGCQMKSEGSCGCGARN